jgi:hypothetical protein
LVSDTISFDAESRKRKGLQVIGIRKEVGEGKSRLGLELIYVSVTMHPQRCQSLASLFDDALQQPSEDERYSEVQKRERVESGESVFVCESTSAVNLVHVFLRWAL